MLTVRLDFRRLLRVVLSILAGLFVITALHQAARASSSHTIVVPANDGYGIEECLAHTKGCGEIVAAAWCEAKGYAAPLAFGRAEDITATIPGASGSKLNPDDFVVTCAD